MTIKIKLSSGKILNVTESGEDAVANHILKEGIKSKSDAKKILDNLHYNHPAVKVIRFLKSIGKLKKGLNKEYKSDFSDFLIEEKIEDKKEDFYKLLENYNLLFKMVSDENLNDFYTQLSDYNYRPKLRARRKISSTHKLDLITKKIIEYRYSDEKKGRSYKRTKKQSSTNLSPKLHTRYFKQHYYDSAIGFLFDKNKCEVRSRLKYDRGTYNRMWVGTKDEVERYQSYISENNLLYTESEIDAFHRHIDTDPTLNELLTEFTQESLRGILIASYKKNNNHEILHSALKRQRDISNKFGITVPIYFYNNSKKTITPISQLEIAWNLSRDILFNSTIFSELDLSSEKIEKLKYPIFNILMNILKNNTEGDIKNDYLSMKKLLGENSIRIFYNIILSTCKNLGLKNIESALNALTSGYEADIKIEFLDDILNYSVKENPHAVPVILDYIKKNHPSHLKQLLSSLLNNTPYYIIFEIASSPESSNQILESIKKYAIETMIGEDQFKKFLLGENCKTKGQGHLLFLILGNSEVIINKIFSLLRKHSPPSPLASMLLQKNEYSGELFIFSRYLSQFLVEHLDIIIDELLLLPETNLSSMLLEKESRITKNGILSYIINYHYPGDHFSRIIEKISTFPKEDIFNILLNAPYHENILSLLMHKSPKEEDLDKILSLISTLDKEQIRSILLIKQPESNWRWYKYRKTGFAVFDHTIGKGGEHLNCIFKFLLDTVPDSAMTILTDIFFQISPRYVPHISTHLKELFTIFIDHQKDGFDKLSILDRAQLLQITIQNGDVDNTKILLNLIEKTESINDKIQILFMKTTSHHDLLDLAIDFIPEIIPDLTKIMHEANAEDLQETLAKKEIDNKNKFMYYPLARNNLLESIKKYHPAHLDSCFSPQDILNNLLTNPKWDIKSSDERSNILEFFKFVTTNFNSHFILNLFKILPENKNRSILYSFAKFSSALASHCLPIMKEMLTALNNLNPTDIFSIITTKDCKDVSFIQYLARRNKDLLEIMNSYTNVISAIFSKSETACLYLASIRKDFLIVNSDSLINRCFTFINIDEFKKIVHSKFSYRNHDQNQDNLIENFIKKRIDLLSSHVQQVVQDRGVNTSPEDILKDTNFTKRELLLLLHQQPPELAPAYLFFLKNKNSSKANTTFLLQNQLTSHLNYLDTYLSTLKTSLPDHETEYKSLCDALETYKTSLKSIQDARALSTKFREIIPSIKVDPSKRERTLNIFLDIFLTITIIPIIIKLLISIKSPIGFFGQTKQGVLVNKLLKLTKEISPNKPQTPG